jgi:hypothetical protein
MKSGHWAKFGPQADRLTSCTTYLAQPRASFFPSVLAWARATPDRGGGPTDWSCRRRGTKRWPPRTPGRRGDAVSWLRGHDAYLRRPAAAKVVWRRRFGGWTVQLTVSPRIGEAGARWSCWWPEKWERKGVLVLIMGRAWAGAREREAAPWREWHRATLLWAVNGLACGARSEQGIVGGPACSAQYNFWFFFKWIHIDSFPCTKFCK